MTAPGRQNFWIGLALLGACLAAHFPGLFGEFTTWDDQLTIARNTALTGGWGGLLEIWSGPREHIYIPVTQSVWWGVAQVFGVWAPAFKGLNLLVHWLSCVLVFGLVRWVLLRGSWGASGTDSRKKERIGSAAFVGALVMAVHPLGVESVAWASGTKDLLGTGLGLAALVSLVSYVRAGGAVWLGVCWVLFGLAVLAKPTAVWVIPAGWVLMWYARLGWRAWVPVVGGWCVMGLGTVTVARWAQPVVEGVEHPALLFRPVVALDAVAWYLGKFVWPVGLTIDAGRNPAWLAASVERYWTWAVPVGLAALAWWLPRLAGASKRIEAIDGEHALDWRALRAGLLLVGAGLLPTLGLMPFDFQVYSTVADHYAHPAMLGLSLIVSVGLVRLTAMVLSLTGWARMVRGRLSLGVFVLWAMLGVVANVQSQVWRNSETLYLHLTRVNPRSMTGPQNLAGMYLDRGEAARALPYLEQASVMKATVPMRAVLAANFGRYSDQTKDVAAAEAHYRRAIELDPTRADLRLLIARFYHRENRLAEAVGAYEATLELEAGNAVAGGNLAAALMGLGRDGEAVAVARRFGQVPAAQNVLGLVAIRSGDPGAAERFFRAAHADAPDMPQYGHNLGLVLLGQGRTGEALALFEKAAAQGYAPSQARVRELKSAP